ncbi:hypothetical protein G2W53_036730 [Senna tora]|uniref:Uncharacterized protein n=1 Tax=Senna tora TaxID=362788 RepID=A0A834SXY5_9FABA|nr:hypothetical protein G2W53_036730 [Senna tora]
MKKDNIIKRQIEERETRRRVRIRVVIPARPTLRPRRLHLELLLLLLIQRQPFIRHVRERSGDHDHRPRRPQLPHHAPSHHLPLPSAQIYSQARRAGRRRRREERSRQRQYLEPSVEAHHGSRASRLPQGHIRNRPAPAQDADPTLPAPRVGGHALEHVAAIAHFQDVGA